MSEEKTMRDEFAMAALTGLLAYSVVNPARGSFHENCPLEGAASIAYQYADAMLAHRKAQP